MYTGRTPRVLRCGAASGVALLLAACVAPHSADMQIGLRNPTVPLGATTRFDADRFAGRWRTVACLGQCAHRAAYRVTGKGVVHRHAAGRDVAYTQSAPGVLRGVKSKEALVVMWVDEGFRTAAIGDADGRWAAVVDRGTSPGADRVRAATEILDFNGWDVSKLRVMK